MKSIEDWRLQAAQLLSDMSRSQTRMSIAEPDDATLMRVADDPLLIHALLKDEQITQALSCSNHPCPPVAHFPFQSSGSVSFQDEGAGRRDSAYVWRETERVNSTFPFRFTPSRAERVLSLDMDERHETDRSKRQRVRLASGVQLAVLVLGCAMVIGLLLRIFD